MGMGSFSKLPGGNVRASRFVILQTNNTVVESGANGDVWGISQAAVRNAALTGWDDGFAGISGDPAINIYGPGDDEAQLALGGTVSAGQKIKSDANGAGVVSTTDKDRVGAVAMRSGVSGDLIPVKVFRYDQSI